MILGSPPIEWGLHGLCKYTPAPNKSHQRTLSRDAETDESMVLSKLR